jgi:hypothetical protein
MAITDDTSYRMPWEFNRLLFATGRGVTDSNMVKMAEAYVVLSAVAGAAQGTVEPLSIPPIAILDAKELKREVVDMDTYDVYVKMKVGEEVQERYVKTRFSQIQSVYMKNPHLEEDMKKPPGLQGTILVMGYEPECPFLVGTDPERGRRQSGATPVFAGVKPATPQRLGTITGRVVGPGSNGKGLAGVKVQSAGLQAITDHSGSYKFALPAAYNGTGYYTIGAELAGYDPAEYPFAYVFSDSAVQAPDIVMWPVSYFDWKAYREIMSARSIPLYSDAPSGGAAVRNSDSVLIAVYRYYLNPTGPLVLRAGTSPPYDDGRYSKQWPELKEYGRYLLIDKGRCRFMRVEMWVTESGMRIWDVDSIKLGSFNKGGFFELDEKSWKRAGGFGLCLKAYLHPYGAVMMSSRGIADHMSAGPDIHWHAVRRRS